MRAPLRPEIDALTPELTAWRRDLHRHPELGFHETRTSRLVAERLASIGLEVDRGLGGTGVVATLHGALGDGATIGLRADMDALPMEEEGEVEHRSQMPGAFHGCGHDGHTTMLLGAAQHLAREKRFAGTVRFVFQPAEEGLGGARAMIEDGLFDRFPCDEVYGLHNWPQLGRGRIGVRNGPMMAASDRLEIVVEGEGGHAAMPHRSVDPIHVASQIVVALQSLVSRSTSPLDAAVVSVTKIDAGSTSNVIPATARMLGTYRTFRDSTRADIEAGIERIATLVARALGATARVTCTRGYPPTVNGVAEADVVRAAAARVVGAEAVDGEIEPSMGGEDFSFMLERVPGAYAWLGANGEHDLHHPCYDFDDGAIPLGVAFWTELVETRLGPR